MDFSLEEDDDEDFGVAKSSHLSNIFGNLEGPDDKQKNTSLRYVAPKQPKRHTSELKKPTDSAAGKLTVVHSSPVNAFKLEDGKYNHQGKLGLALLGNYETRNFMLLLYKDKQSTVTKVSININFVYTAQDNNYANFYDDQRINWSVNFDNLQSYQDFAVQVAIAKINSANAILDSPIIQDTSCGTGQPVSIGETIYIKYCCWILSDYKLGQVLSSNWEDHDACKQIQVGNGCLFNVFDTGIVNIKRGGQRVIIFQSHHASGSKDTEIKIPDKATVVLRVEVKLDDHSFSSPHHLLNSEKPSVPSKPASNILTDDATIKARSASISEQLQSSPKTDKAKLISRMAKMGKPMLPVQSGTFSSRSESDTEEERPLSTESHPIPNPRTKVKLNSRHEDSQHNYPSIRPVEFPTAITAQPQHLPLSLSSSQSVMPVAATPSYVLMPGQTFMTGSSSLDSHVPVLLSEVRTQNTELRMQMSQVTDKLERVLEKVGQTIMYPTMEVGVLAENINRIMQENEKLKQMIKDKDAKIEILSERMSDLLQSHQRVLEKSNTMLEQRSDHLQYANSEHQTRVQSLELEKTQLLQDLTVAQATVKKLEIKISEFQTSDAKLRENLQELNDSNLREQDVHRKVDELTAELNELKIYSEDIGRTLKVKETEYNDFVNRSRQTEQDFQELTLARNNDVVKLSKEKEDLINEIQRLQGVVKTANKETPSSDSKLPSSLIINEIKKVMNAVYKSLQKQFTLEQEYSGSDIKSALASAIRQITLEVIESYSEVNPADSNIGVVKKEEAGDSHVSTSENLQENKGKNEHVPAKKPEVKEAESDTTVTSAANESNVSTQINTSGVDETLNEPWRPQPPPFVGPDSEEDDDDDWLN